MYNRNAGRLSPTKPNTLYSLEMAVLRCCSSAKPDSGPASNTRKQRATSDQSSLIVTIPEHQNRALPQKEDTRPWHTCECERKVTRCESRWMLSAAASSRKGSWSLINEWLQNNKSTFLLFRARAPKFRRKSIAAVELPQASKSE